MQQSVLHWRRGPRASFALSAERGVYALFLDRGVRLPGIKPGESGLLYIGLAANRDGLKGRCHFNARTVNHSPRKSLAVLLMDELKLKPVMVEKPNASDTWGLDPPSDARLSGWMHKHLLLAIEVCDDPDARETELVSHHAPPLNLTKCLQTAQHRRISSARRSIMSSLRVGVISGSRPAQSTIPARGSSTRKFPKAEHHGNVNLLSADLFAAVRFSEVQMDTAEAIAARYGLNAKSYRQRLRDTISWYRKPQDWTFAVGSIEWRDMIAAAEAMVPRLIALPSP